MSVLGRVGVVLLALAAAAEAESDSEAIDRLVAQSVRLERAGRVREAIAAVAKAAAIERRVLGADHWDVAGSHHRIAELHERLGELDQARPHLLAIVEIADRRKVAWQATDARRYLADFDRRRAMTPDEKRLLAQVKLLDRQKKTLWRAKRFRDALPVTAQARGIVESLWGARHPEHARKLHELGLLHHELGEYANAEPYLREALAVRRAVLGDGHPLTAESLHNLGSVRLDRGDLARAGPLLERARAAYAAARGRADPGFLEILRTLGRYRREAGDLDGAERVLRDALAGARSVLGEEHPEYPRYLDAMAKLQLVRGDGYRARRLFEEALQSAPDERRTAMLLVGLGTANRLLGRFAEAERALDDGLKGLRAALGETHPLCASALNEQALLEHARGRPNDALSLLLEARSILGADAAAHPAVLTSLAAVYDSLGEFETARGLLDAVRATLHAIHGPEHPRTATTLLNAAALYRNAGDPLGAVPLAEEAVAAWRRIVGERHPIYAVALSNLGEIYRSAGDHVRARTALDECVALAPDLLRDSPWHVTCLSNLGGLLVETGELARAETVLDDALERAQRLGADHPWRASALDNRATLYRATGDSAAAARDTREALRVLEKAYGRGHPDVIRTLVLLATAHLDAGEPDAATPLIERALRADKTHPAHLDALLASARLHAARGDHVAARALLAGVHRAREETLGDDHPRTVDALRRTAVAALAAGDRAGAAALLERARAAGKAAFGDTHPAYADILEASAAERRAARDRAGAVAFLRDALPIRRRHLDLPLPERRLLAMTAHLKTTLHAFVEVAEPDDAYRAVLPWKGAVFARQRLLRHRRRHSAQQDRFAELERAQRLLAALALAPPGLRHPAEVLPADAVLVDYVAYGARVAAFVSRRGEPTRRVDLGEAEPIARRVETWRRALHAGAADGVALGAEVARRVWTPLAPLAAGRRLVLVSPDGPLNRVPFAALPGASGRALAEEVAVVLVTAPGLLGDATADDRPPAEGLLLVGDVDFGVAAWAPLPATRQEIAEIERVYRKAAPGLRVARLDRRAATERAFRAAVGRHRHVHCATHGFLASPRLRSALRNEGVGWHPGLLAGIVLGANDGDDGRVTALELAGLDLAGVDLMVLSACETGLGESAGGEGPIGLLRGARIGGVRQVVGSLWRVDDAATRDFMLRFYRALWTKGLRPVEALRAAQRALIAAKAPPRHWAPWVIAGDGR